MDTGYHEAEIAFKQGADIVSICGNADNSTISQAVKAAKKYKRKIIVDMISVKNPKKRFNEIKNINFDYLLIHTGIDSQKKGRSPLNDLKKISKSIEREKIAVAGGINLKNISKIMKLTPEIIIIGGCITKSKDPKNTSRKLKENIYKCLAEQIKKDTKKISHRKYKDIKDKFKNLSKIKKDKILYTVYVNTLDKEKNIALTSINPGDIQGEYFMTKGHKHSNPIPEEYILISGKGKLLLQDKKPKTIELKPFKKVHIPGKSAHRLINTGKTKMEVLSIYNKNSNPNYNFEFKKRIFKKNEK
jgi:3-hexulose-6-phosphate synthase